MGRLSAYAKNRILKLRFKKNKRIIHIVEILKKDDNIKVSRQAVSTFLKKYLETNSIYDKPRTGRKRKLTQEEIQLIGQVTRLNRDITARAIKEYLNLNVSTYTILRATKLFEWNKINPNSNDSKKAAALERQLNGSGEIVPSATKSKANGGIKRYKRKSNSTGDAANGNGLNETSGTHVVSIDDSMTDLDKTNEDFDRNSSITETETVDFKKSLTKDHSRLNESNNEPEKIDLNLIQPRELLSLKNLSCSPMSFATKILFKIFRIEELHGHNVSGKTLNKNLKAKLPLDPIRVGYIKFLVESYYDEKECKEMLSGVTSNRQDLWKSCHTAINKSILISERKAAAVLAKGGNPNLETSENLSDVENIAAAAQNHHKKAKSTRVKDSDTDSDDDDDSDIEMPPKLLKAKVQANKKNTTTRRGGRASRSSVKKPAKKGQMYKEFDDTDEDEEDDDEDMDDDLDSDEDDDMDEFDESEDDELEYEEIQIKEEEDECPNEIELIQKIENRLVNVKPSTQTSKSPYATRNSSAKLAKKQTQTPVQQQEPVPPPPQQSTEASAAANIAAAMKKRFVVIASTQKQTSTAATTH